MNFLHLYIRKTPTKFLFGNKWALFKPRRGRTAGRGGARPRPRSVGAPRKERVRNGTGPRHLAQHGAGEAGRVRNGVVADGVAENNT